MKNIKDWNWSKIISTVVAILTFVGGLITGKVAM